MPSARRARRGLRRWSAAPLAVAVVAGVALAGASQAVASTGSAAPASGSSSATGHDDQKGYLDARQVDPASEAGLTSAARQQRQVASLRRSLGSDAVVDIDPLTGTPRNLMRLSGFLTGPSSASAAAVTMHYLRSHLAQLGLQASDLTSLRLRNDYVDPEGTHHLSFTQWAKGVQVFGNGLRAHVTADGRLVALQGSPVARIASLAASQSTTPALSADAARSASAHDVGGTTVSATATPEGRTTAWSNGDDASLVWFATPAGLRLGWSTFVTSGDAQSYSHVVDATTGRVLYRRNLVQSDRGDAKVYDNYPGAARGGKPKVVNFFRRGWLPKGSTWLRGDSVTAFADLNDDNSYSAREKTPVPGTKNAAQFTLKPFHSNPWCSAQYVCTWNPNKPYSWRTNMKADVTNAFYLASNFHDYLAKPPFGFNRAAGNFSRVGGDPVRLNALDGANTNHGLPDGNHIDNANMSTPPDGQSPTMQMYLFHYPGTTNAQDPFLPATGSVSADVLYHEYTHGLSNRLVVDPSGASTLNSIQAGSMGEAWSDYYALDYLVTKGFIKDGKRPGEVLEGKYLGHNQPSLRTEAIDCNVHSKARLCTQIDGTTKGGYTYGDFATVGGSPEVHSSGEIWGQTLWDLRTKFGHRVADTLITRGMSLSPANPSFLDERNAIIEADQVAFHGRHTAGLWEVFASRGMGWYAGAIDAGDIFPAQDFHVRPKGQTPGTVTGTVTDALSGDPVQGALVRITGHPGYSAVTDASGDYSISGIIPGTYKKSVITTDGYETVTGVLKVDSGSNPSQDAQVRRDWASASGTAQVSTFTGPDYSPQCGPGGAIDLSQSAGWGSTTGNNKAVPTNTMIPKKLVVKLPQQIDITTGSGVNSAFKVDPTATCGDPGSASTGDFTIEVRSTTSDPWTKVVDVSGEGNWLPRFTFTQLQASQAVPNVQYVRLTLNSPQVPSFATTCPNGPYAGCQFTDFTELEVFGPPSP